MSVFLLITIFYCVKKIDFKEKIRLLDFLDSIAHMQVSDFLLKHFIINKYHSIFNNT